MNQQGANLSSLPGDLWSMILEHDAEKQALKKEINELRSIIDHFAEYVAYATSRSDFNNVLHSSIRIGGGKKEDLFVSQKTPDLKKLGESLFAQLKCIDPQSDHSCYAFTNDATDDSMWDIELLRAELFLHNGRGLL